MKKTATIFTALLLALASGCGPGEKKSGAPVVAASIFPVSDIAKRIGGNRVSVFYVIPAGANPHIYEPRPSMATELGKTDLFIGIDPEYDGWIKKYLPKKAGHAFLKEKMKSRRYSDNPHIWLTVRGAAEIAAQISGLLSGIDPAGGKYFEKNLEEYRTELRALDAKISGMFGKCGNKKFIQWHPAWDYFAEDYGLEISGTIEKGHGDVISVRSFRDLIRKAARDRVGTITVELNVDSREVDALSRETGARVARMDSVGDPEVKEKSGYAALMLYNARILSESLCREGR